MEELAARILEDQKDQAAHPENWRIILQCRQCSRTKDFPTHKDEVNKYRNAHAGSDVLVQDSCEQCTEPEDQE